MHALIVVESMFGNTRVVADAVAEGLRDRLPVEVRDLADTSLSLRDDLSLLIVGGPTHAFGMSRASTRADAVGRGASVRADTGIREWLDMLGGVPAGLPAATLDTRINKRFVPGSAAKAAARRMRRMGCEIVTPAESFYVADVAGPLRNGELGRARRFGQDVADELERRGLLPEAA